jgi:hypothetical protein
VNTVEIKIRKEFLDQNTPEKEIDTLAYVLYLGQNASGQQMWHRFDNTTASQAALGNSWWMYEYMVFVDIDNPISMRETASVRLSSTNSGLRFKTEVATEKINYLKSTFKNVQVGILISPKDILGSNKLTHNFGTVGTDYVDVVADVDNPFEVVGGVAVYAGSIVNIREGNLERDFVAVGYLKLTDNNGAVTYYYSENMAERNVSEVASAAFFDIKTTEQSGYRRLITADNDIMKGSYSPYTTAQREILASLIPSNDKKDPTAPDIF